jgi:hypothetical protein
LAVVELYILLSLHGKRGGYGAIAGGALQSEQKISSKRDARGAAIHRAKDGCLAGPFGVIATRFVGVHVLD